MTLSIIIAIGCLMGAAGVMLVAASAHAVPGAGLDSAGYLLLLHGIAALGAALALNAGLAWRPLALAGVIGLIAGAVLFAGDVSLRAFAGQRLFPMAAPAGGMILIAGWVVLAAAALVAARG
jgi:uncharacterized membrane protein YgdD (TMEM256/DUF423 family)